MAGILFRSTLLILAATIVTPAPIDIGPDGLGNISPLDKILEESGYQLAPPTLGKTDKLLDQTSKRTAPSQAEAA
ncbi:hypothetical protein SLS62_001729 [Diatrype stigma]|uniref:Uncharacterized protein n=1 Tax=Diatrype stigma TaxID=117547 RepID=A0AAN9YVG9_9PEZI